MEQLAKKGDRLLLSIVSWIFIILTSYGSKPIAVERFCPEGPGKHHFGGASTYCILHPCHSVVVLYLTLKGRWFLGFEEQRIVLLIERYCFCSCGAATEGWAADRLLHENIQRGGAGSATSPSIP
jgi:hypothetical protein